MAMITRDTVGATFLERVNQDADRVGFLYKKESSWIPVTYREFFEKCKDISNSLMELGIVSEDRVAILSNSRIEWSLIDMAILGAKAITVPIYPSSTAQDITYLLNDSEASVLFVEDSAQWSKILEAKNGTEKLSHLQKIILIDPTSLDLSQLPKKVIGWSEFLELGKEVKKKTPSRFEENLKSAKPSDLITICYTSGTTGIPKGAMISHENMMSVLSDCVDVFGRYFHARDQVVLSFLPFSHIFGKVESMAIYTFGWKQAFNEHLDKLMTNLVEIRPTLIFAVPRIFEKALVQIFASIEKESRAKRKLFEWAMKAGQRYFSVERAGKKHSLSERAQFLAARAFIFRHVTQRFGGRIKFSICGGAPLSREIAETFQIMGIPVLEGYGLTETCAPVTLNAPHAYRFGTVGKPLPEVSIKTAEDGELLIRSRKVFHGYYNMPDETNQVLADGWLHTGDVGFIDAQGFVCITDRKKDLIITSSGKNIAPQKLENLVRASRWVSHFVVCGERRNYLTALVTLNHEEVIRYASEKHILFSEYQELIRHPKIIAKTQSVIDEMNRGLASFETIKKFLVLPGDFSVENGELTPSLKIRRKIIEERYHKQIDNLYQGHG